MRAVNLIPREERGGVGAPTRSGGAVYVVLGGLATAMLAAVLLRPGRQRGNRPPRPPRPRRSAGHGGSDRGGTSGAVRPVRPARGSRVATVQQLAASRFRWHQVMGDLARVLPSDVALTAFTGSLSGSSGASGSASTPATAPTPAPAAAAAAQIARLARRDGQRSRRAHPQPLGLCPEPGSRRDAHPPPAAGERGNRRDAGLIHGSERRRPPAPRSPRHPRAPRRGLAPEPRRAARSLAASPSSSR